MLVTIQTAEILIIIRIRMASATVIPDTGVITRTNRKEHLMVWQKSRPPNIHLMAFITLGRQTGTDVAGTGNFEVVCLMTINTASRVE